MVDPDKVAKELGAEKTEFKAKKGALPASWVGAFKEFIRRLRKKEKKDKEGGE